MEIDIRKYDGIRAQAKDGLQALRLQGRQIWGNEPLDITAIVIRLTVDIGDLARLARDHAIVLDRGCPVDADGRDVVRREIKKEFGNIIFSTIRWVDDLGFDVMECLDLAIEAQEKFAKSGRPR